MEKRIEKIIDIPSGVNITQEGHLLKVKGQKTTIEKKIAYPKMKIEIQNNKIHLSTQKGSRNEKRMLGTFTAHIKNMIEGSQKEYVYKLKICSGHFPMKVTVEKDRIVIANFLGEKIPRKAKILPGISVKVQNDIIIVEGSEKEKTGQTAANIENATRITNRDRRIFQDGCYILVNEA